MPWVAPVLSIAGKVGGVVAKDREMRAEEVTHKYNARVSEQAAKDVERDSRGKANQQRGANERTLARQRALYAASGVAGGTGSPLMVEVEQAGQLEMAALDMEIAGSREGQQHRTEAELSRGKAASARRARKMAALGAALSVGTSLFNSFKGSGPKAGGTGTAANGVGGSGTGGGQPFMFTK